MEKITSPTLVYHWVHPWLGWCEMTLEWLMDGFWHWGYIIIGIAGKSGVPFSMAVGNCPQDFIHFYSILQWTFIDRCGKPRCEAIVLSMYIYIYIGVDLVGSFKHCWLSNLHGMMIQGLEKPPPTPWFPLGDVLGWGSEDCDVALIGGNRWEPGNLGTCTKTGGIWVSGRQIFVSSRCIK